MRRPDDVTYDRFRPEDAPGVADLFRAVYGEGYPVRTFYEPESLTLANERNEVISAVARDGGGRVVGHVAFYRSTPYPLLYEMGAGLVLREWRSKGIINHLAVYLLERVVPEIEIEESFLEPVCNHTITQRTGLRLGYVPSAIEIDLMPAEAYDAEKSAIGRVSTVLGFLCHRARPQTVCLPARWADALRVCYAGIEDDRRFVTSTEEFPAGSASEVAEQSFPGAQVTRVSVTAIGADFADRVAAFDEQAAARGDAVVQVSLPLSKPEVGAAAEILRDRGYFLCGVQRRWLDGDAMLMQRTAEVPGFDTIRLLGDKAERLLALIRADYESLRP